jgi:nucleoside-diphosphate-sugar epimerase
MVNVVGTVNVLESIARRRDRMGPLVYASSVAAFGAVDPDDCSAPATTEGTPGTLYGVYKRANEATAAMYWQDRGVMSVGLRPHTVYGLGRDQGLTSAPTQAMIAAAAGAAFQIPFGGRCQFQYAPDVARAFLRASRARVDGAVVHNLPGRPVHMHEIVDAIEAAAPASAGLITYVEQPLPFPADIDATSWTACFGEPQETPVRVGVAATVERLRTLIADGRVLVDGGAPGPRPSRTGASRHTSVRPPSEPRSDR